MKRLLRRLSRAVASAADDDVPASRIPAPVHLPKPRREGNWKGRPMRRRKAVPAVVPAGHVPVCVGEEGGPVERFAVRTELLGDPAFAALLRVAAQEYGYAHPGALRIPCPVADFRRLLLRLSAAAAATAGDHHPAACAA